MTYDAIFDLDGTLVDSLSVCAQIANAMLADRGSARRVSHDLMREHISLGGARMMSALMGDACGDPEQAIREFRQRYAQAPTPDTSLYAGVREGLAHLRDQGFRLSVCSSKPEDLCEKVLSELSLSGEFSLIMGSRPGRPGKPSPALYQEVIERLSGRSEHSCYVGDSELDHGLACASGVPFVFAAYGYGGAGFQPQGAYRATDFADVPSLISEAFTQALSGAPQRVLA